MRSDPPLLAQEEASESPALGTSHVEMDQSPLERLIQQSTSEQRNNAAVSTPFLLDGQFSTSNTVDGSPSLTQATGSLVFTLVAGSLWIVQSGLVWASFVSSSWFETRLLLKVDWIGGTTDQLIYTTTLASLLSTFLSVDLHWAAVCLLLASLVLPCLAMILLAAWTVMDHKDRFSRATKQMGSNYPRLIFEYILRLSLVTFMALAILDVAATPVELDSNGTDLKIVNRTKGGLVCYTLGMCCALGVIAVLRLVDANDKRPPTAHVVSRSRRVPPSRAFQLPWNSQHITDADQREPLLDTEQQEENAAEGRNNERQAARGPRASGYSGLSCCKRVLLFETGIVSTCLIPPALLLPLFTLNFGGLASDFMTETTLMVRFCEFPFLLRRGAIAGGTEHWILVVLGAAFISFVYVLPLVATFLSIGVWRSTSKSRLYYKLLQVIQPCLCGSVFALSVLIAVPAFGPIGEHILNEKTSGVCTKFHLITSDHCLTLDGEQNTGSWILLAQSITLELFVLMTLAWRK